MSTTPPASNPFRRPNDSGAPGQFDAPGDRSVGQPDFGGPLKSKQPHRSGFARFWTTLPGLLTASAGLVASVAAVAGIFFGNQDRGTTTVTLPTVPTVPTYIVIKPEDKAVVADFTQSAPSSEEQLFADCEAGDPDACHEVLTLLIDQCSAGDGLRCDVLYTAAPVGSDLEYFGNTCGYRFDPPRGWCENLL